MHDGKFKPSKFASGEGRARHFDILLAGQIRMRARANAVFPHQGRHKERSPDNQRGDIAASEAIAPSSRERAARSFRSCCPDRPGRHSVHIPCGVRFPPSHTLGGKMQVARSLFWVESISTQPPCNSTKERTMERPRPTPRWRDPVV